MYNLTHALIDRTRSAAAGSFMRSRKSVNDSAAPAEAASTASASASDCDDAICFFSFLFFFPFLFSQPLLLRCDSGALVQRRRRRGRALGGLVAESACGQLWRAGETEFANSKVIRLLSHFFYFFGAKKQKQKLSSCETWRSLSRALSLSQL